MRQQCYKCLEDQTKKPAQSTLGKIHRHFHLLVGLSFGLAAGITYGQQAQTLVGTTELAQLGVHQEQRRAQINTLLEATLTSAKTLPERLQAIATDPQRPVLERDALIHGYAMALRQLRPNQVDASSLDWLAQYHPQAWRIHEESSSYRIPVFDVTATLAGTRNEWDYQSAQEAVSEATHAHQAEHQLLRYQHASRAFQQGFVSQLAQLDKNQIAIWQHALQRFPQLQYSAAAGELITQSSDQHTLIEWLTHAPDGTALKVLRQVVAQLNQDQNENRLFQLCATLLQQTTPVAAAAHCISLASPSLFQSSLQRAAWQELLHQQLADPRNGAAAAQQLATVIDSETLQQWQQHPHNELEQQRLQLIVQLRHSLAQVRLDTEGQ